MVTSCTKKIKQIPQQNYWQHYEARLYDIPLLINAKPLNDYCKHCDSDQAIQLGYCTDVLKSDVIAFYQQEMERAGWLEFGIVRGFEIVMQFEKPKRFCTILVREDTSCSLRIVVVSVGLKK